MKNDKYRLIPKYAHIALSIYISIVVLGATGSWSIAAGVAISLANAYWVGELQNA